MHLTAAIRRHGAPVAAAAGIALFAGALGGLTGIDHHLQAAITPADPGVTAPVAPDTAPPVRVSDAGAGRDCAGERGGDGSAGLAPGSPHDAQEL